MAIFKAEPSKVDIQDIINHATKEENVDVLLTSGFNCSPETAVEEMMFTKLLYGKTGGREYKHYVQSFHKDEDITPELAHQIAQEFVEQNLIFKDFEVLIATCKDKDRIYTHFIVNSVSIEDGHKISLHKNCLREMKDLSDDICRKHGLTICEKGKTFEGQN